jgi:hypothetical protein
VNIPTTEERFASCWSDGVFPDDETIETLVQSLLSSLAGHRHRSLDGVISMWHGTTSSGLEIQGAAITIDDQCAHPIEFSLLFGQDKRLSDGSRVSFGLNDLPNPYGSPEHSRLMNRLLASFPAHFQWLYTFIRNQNDWALSVA